MASRKSPSNARSAPKGKGRLAAFASYVEALANGHEPTSDVALARALTSPGAMRSSNAWKTFAQQVAQSQHHGAACRVLPPWEALPPLP